VGYNPNKSKNGYISKCGNIACYGNIVKDKFTMSSTRFDLLVHPIRIRIITAISADRVTAKDLAKALPDIPQTTLYRHINILVDGGILQVVEEIPQRGTVERVFGFKTPPSLTQEDLIGLSKEEYQQAFTLIMSTLLNDAISYINSVPDEEEIDLLGAGFDFNKIQLNLSDEEYKIVNKKILDIAMAAAVNKPTEDRKRRIFSYLFIPVVESR
jgi:DNA-binding transcriptional ArsR family regulator